MVVVVVVVLSFVAFFNVTASSGEADVFNDPLFFADFFKLVLVATMSANSPGCKSSNRSLPLDCIKPSWARSAEGKMGEAAVKVIPMLVK